MSRKLSSLIFFSSLSLADSQLGEVRLAVCSTDSPRNWIDEHALNGLIGKPHCSAEFMERSGLIIDRTDWEQSCTVLRCYTASEVFRYARSRFQIEQTIRSAIQFCSEIDFNCFPDAVEYVDQHDANLSGWARHQHSLWFKDTVQKIFATWYVIYSTNADCDVVEMSGAPVIGRFSALAAVTLINRHLNTECSSFRCASLWQAPELNLDPEQFYFLIKSIGFKCNLAIDSSALDVFRWIARELPEATDWAVKVYRKIEGGMDPRAEAKIRSERRSSKAF